MDQFEQKFNHLPKELQNKVIHYIDFLLSNNSTSKVTSKKIEFTWVGVLKEHKSQFTSVELQKKAQDWFK